jgi:hypothetical protein
MFIHEYAVNDDANAIVKAFDDRVAPKRTSMDGISVCLVDDFGEPIDAHLIASVGRRKRRRALGNAKLAGDPLVGLFGSDATNPYSFRIYPMESTPWALRSIGICATNRFERGAPTI